MNKVQHIQYKGQQPVSILALTCTSVAFFVCLSVQKLPFGWVFHSEWLLWWLGGLYCSRGGWYQGILLPNIRVSLSAWQLRWKLPPHQSEQLFHQGGDCIYSLLLHSTDVNLCIIRGVNLGLKTCIEGYNEGSPLIRVKCYKLLWVNFLLTYNALHSLLLCIQILSFLSTIWSQHV